eukprot:CAMPEP_0182913842 /NCGR_PEP_ID=MMETSP0034_2-20130328/38246_1 /TAXON_ID=156128 /ORGANISM="Nephroselmis pyriformis, Strain CCMP717" /LENGTH=448 /DNA_ID=CAMNT_0025050571 /DNA_START=342 /DNA_END=1684 /DNA_ORIENTATION=-
MPAALNTVNGGKKRKGCGSCHKCSASLDEASKYTECPKCNCRYHTFDCGGRITIIHEDPITRALECPRCSNLCMCTGGAMKCHVGAQKRKRAESAAAKSARRHEQLIEKQKKTTSKSKPGGAVCASPGSGSDLSAYGLLAASGGKSISGASNGSVTQHGLQSSAVSSGAGSGSHGAVKHEGVVAAEGVVVRHERHSSGDSDLSHPAPVYDPQSYGASHSPVTSRDSSRRQPLLAASLAPTASSPLGPVPPVGAPPAGYILADPMSTQQALAARPLDVPAVAVAAAAYPQGYVARPLDAPAYESPWGHPEYNAEVAKEEPFGAVAQPIQNQDLLVQISEADIKSIMDSEWGANDKLGGPSSGSGASGGGSPGPSDVACGSRGLAPASHTAGSGDSSDEMEMVQSSALFGGVKLDIPADDDFAILDSPTDRGFTTSIFGKGGGGGGGGGG